ncbi:MAG: efflux RND transporter periplasmic adaptor subunit [Candidatus Sumerlaea chitinivorans]|nr:efflux RND transporter periplasmic adaptor subunit [Candidatus Sumerlaea chitinivorans]
MAPRTRKLLVAVLLVLGIFLLIGWQTGAFESKIPASTPPLPSTPELAGNVVPVERLDVPMTEEAVGTVQSRHKVDITPRIQAVIEKILVSAGDHVKQGDLLVVLDKRDLEANVGQAEQALKAAEANYRQAVTDHARNMELLQRQVISPQEADNSRLRVEVTSATVGQARRAYEQAKVALSYAEITAPVSGIVTDKYQNTGEMAMPGKPILSLYDPSLVRLEVPVREALVRFLKVRDEVTVRLGADDLLTTGILDEIVPQADVASRSVLVKVLIPNVGSLYTGMFGRLIIPTGTERILAVPARAIERVGQLEYVLVPTSHGPERRFVQTGRRFGDKVEVLSGVTDKDRVLIPAEGSKE